MLSFLGKSLSPQNQFTFSRVLSLTMLPALATRGGGTHDIQNVPVNLKDEQGRT